MWLLHRTLPADKFEGLPMFKCGISYEDTLGLAKGIGCSVENSLWGSVLCGMKRVHFTQHTYIFPGEHVAYYSARIMEDPRNYSHCIPSL